MRTLTAALALCASLASTSPASAWSELHSFSQKQYDYGCTGGDVWFSLQSEGAGAGQFPSGPVMIVGYDIAYFGKQPADYLMFGKTPANEGDAFTPYLFGTEHTHSDPYTAVNGFAFNPTAGDQLHAHYACAVAEGTVGFQYTIYYVTQ